MNNENNMNREFSPSGEGEYFDLRAFFLKLLDHWWWFVISVPLCIMIAFYICLSSTPVYQVETKVMISDTKKGEIGVNPMMKELGLFQGNMAVENEIVELKSKNLVQEVVRELELNVDYTRERFPRDRKLYKDSPIKVLVDMPEHVKDTVLYVSFVGEGVKVCNEDREVIFEGGFSEVISFGMYNVSIEKLDSLAREGDEIRVDLLSCKTVTNRVYKQLAVSILEKNTSAVRVSVKDAIPARGKDILDALVRGYNNNGITDKQLVSSKTVEFINDRLKVINRELGDIESDAELFKKQNQLTDITSVETGNRVGRGEECPGLPG